jgi:hypothetical protein
MPLRYLFGQDELVASFVAAMIPHLRGYGFGKCRAVGVVDGDNELIAGWVYHASHPEAAIIEISAAALPGHLWVTRETLNVLYGFPFLQCKCQMVVHKVLASNERLLRQFAALGCMLIAIPRLFGRHEDGVLCLLTDEEWKANKIFQRIHRAEERKQQEAA